MKIRIRLCQSVIKKMIKDTRVIIKTPKDYILLEILPDKKERERVGKSVS